MQNRTRLDLSYSLSAPEVGERLRHAADELGQNKRVLAHYLYDMQERHLYQVSGHGSTVHFAETQLDMEPRRTREYIQVGRALSDLVLLDEAFCDHEIGWSKVTALLPVVQQETQEAWVEYAKGHTFKDVREEVFGCKPGYLPGEGGGYGLICRKTVFSAKLTDEVYAMLEEARMRFSDSAEGLMTNEELMADLLRSRLYGDERRKAELKPSAERPDGWSAERPTERPIERNDEEVPEDVREQVLRRDKHRCCNCDNHLDVEVHHIRFRSEGGSNEPANLITLCMTCHASIHREFLKIVGDRESRNVVFFGRDGAPVIRGERSPSGALFP